MARHNVTPRALWRFDHYLDDLAEGRTPDATGLDPSLTSVVQRLYRQSAQPNRHHERSRTTNANVARPIAGTGWERRSRTRVCSRLRPTLSRTVAFGSTAALFAVIVAGIVFTMTPGSGSGPEGGPWLYLVDYERGEIVEVNRETLKATNHVIRRFESADMSNPSSTERIWRVSPDGASIAELVVKPGAAQAFGIGPSGQLYAFDSGTGRQVSTLVVDTAFFPFTVSNGGERIIFSELRYSVKSDGPVDNQQFRWRTFDGTSGAYLGITQSGGLDAIGPSESVVSPDGTRAYALVTEPGSIHPGPWTTNVAVFDLVSGTNSVVVPIAGLRSGTWLTKTHEKPGTCMNGSDSSVETVPMDGTIEISETAGLAISPDGNRLAVADPAGTRVTLINATTGAVERVFLIDPSPATGTPALRGCILRSSVETDLWFAGNDTLILTGITLQQGTDAEQVWTNHAVRRIDLTSGVITSKELPTEPNARTFVGVVAGTDEDLYVVTTAILAGGSGSVQSTLRLWDAQTLEEKRQRKIESARSDFLVVPLSIAPFQPIPPDQLGTPVGGTEVVIRAFDELQRVTVIVDGATAFDGPIADYGYQVYWYRDSITIVSSDPAQTGIGIGGTMRIMLNNEETYPRE